jgi:hypothetical protein
MLAGVQPKTVLLVAAKAIDLATVDPDLDGPEQPDKGTVAEDRDIGRLGRSRYRRQCAGLPARRTSRDKRHGEQQKSCSDHSSPHSPRNTPRRGIASAIMTARVAERQFPTRHSDDPCLSAASV